MSCAAWFLSRDLWSVVVALFVINYLVIHHMKGGTNFLKPANILKV